MLPRKITPVLRQRLAHFPAVGLVGPRQCGKTTLARSFDGAYYDLEQEPERVRLDLEWSRLLAPDAGLVILDEAQAWPEVFVRLRGAIDEDRRRNGRFLLLGSVSPALMREVSESLAGRLALVELTPLSLTELDQPERSRRWLLGGYPDGGVLGGPHRFPVWQSNYLSLLAQRDLPNWGLPARPQATERLLNMLAAAGGQEWNASAIGKSLGLAYHTVNGYLDYLDGAFLTRQLPAFHRNIRKRLVKRPKLHWRDSGLLHALLGVADEAALLRHPHVGASWEGFVVDQVLTALGHAGDDFRASHMRTVDQREIDLVLELPSAPTTRRPETWAIEAKLTASPRPHDLNRLNATADLIDADRRILVTHGGEWMEGDREMVGSLDDFADWIGQHA